MSPDNKSEYYMSLALSEAKSSSSDGTGPYGAVVVDPEGNVIGVGRNTVHASHDITNHAETSALRDAASKLGTHKLIGCSLFSTAEPCIMCMGAIVWSRISHVYFGITLTELEGFKFEQVMITDSEIASKSPWKIKVTGGVLRQDCLDFYEQQYQNRN